MDKSAAAEDLVAAFEAVTVYMVTDCFQVNPDDLPALKVDIHEITVRAMELGSGAVNAPAAALTEVVSTEYTKSTSIHVPVTSTETGVQVSPDEWAWLLSDTLEKVFVVPTLHRVEMHSRAREIFDRYSRGATSVYLPAALRSRVRSLQGEVGS